MEHSLSNVIDVFISIYFCLLLCMNWTCSHCTSVFICVCNDGCWYLCVPVCILIDEWTIFCTSFFVSLPLYQCVCSRFTHCVLCLHSNIFITSMSWHFLNCRWATSEGNTPVLVDFLSYLFLFSFPKLSSWLFAKYRYDTPTKDIQKPWGMSIEILTSQDRNDFQLVFASQLIEK